MKTHKARCWWYLLLLIPFIATLWVPFYNLIEPKWYGFPFFYWYQLLWVFITPVIILIVHLLTKRSSREGRKE